MLNNLVIFLVLLFVSVQIARCKPHRIITLSLISSEMLFVTEAGGNTIEDVQNELLLNVDVDIADSWRLQMIDFCEQIIHKLRIIVHD